MDINNITFLPMNTGFLVLLIIQRIILYECILYDRPRANYMRNKKLYRYHGNGVQKHKCMCKDLRATF